MTTQPYMPQPISDMERRQILHNALVMETTQGNRVAWVGVHEAHVWRMPPKTNHLIHLLLTLFTFGLWLIVWLIVALTEPAPQLVGVAVDASGVLHNFPVRRPPVAKRTH